MQKIGSFDLVGFQLGPVGESPSFRHLQIYIAGDCVSDDRQSFIPGVLGGMIPERNFLRSQLNFLKHQSAVADLNLTEIHNAFLHVSDGEGRGELKAAAQFHSFMDWGIPETDVFRSFLCPFRGQLWLTHQKWVDHNTNFAKLNVVDGVSVCPYDLIEILSDAIDRLSHA